MRKKIIKFRPEGMKLVPEYTIDISQDEDYLTYQYREFLPDGNERFIHIPSTPNTNEYDVLKESLSAFLGDPDTLFRLGSDKKNLISYLDCNTNYYGDPEDIEEITDLVKMRNMELLRIFSTEVPISFHDSMELVRKPDVYFPIYWNDIGLEKRLN